MALFHVQRTPLASVLEVEEDLNAFTSPALEKAVRIAESVSGLIIVRLEYCNYCDSSGLGVFIRLKQRLGNRIIFVIPKNVAVRHIFEITDLIGVLDITDELPDPLLLSPRSS